MQAALARPALAIDALEVPKLLTAFAGDATGRPPLTDLAERARLTDRVEVRTMVTGKGLEYDAIVVLGLDEAELPTSQPTRAPAKCVRSGESSTSP